MKKYLLIGGGILALGILVVYASLQVSNPLTRFLAPKRHIFIRTLIQTNFGEGSLFEQIWQAEESDQPERLFDLPNRSDKLMSEAFSATELAAFDDWRNFRQSEGATYPPANEIYPIITTGDMALSPDGQWLAWFEATYWSPPEASTTSFSMQRLVVFNLASGEKKTLHEIPNHISVSAGIEYTIENDLAGLAWSPDGRQIAFVEGWRGNYQAKVVDVVTGQIENIGGPDESDFYLSWSPDGTAIVTDKPYTLNILSTRGQPTRKDIAGSWGELSGLDWSPDGKTIVFAAAKKIYDKFQLYILNPETGELGELPLDKNLSYVSPRWSPDGKLIAINAGSDPTGRPDQLLVYDVGTQKIVAMLTGKRSREEWYWSDDSQTILLTKGHDPDIPYAVVLFYWRENRTETIPFPEGIKAGMAIGISLK